MVEIDKDACIGCGTCAALCSDVFELGSDGKAHIKEGADTNKPCVKEAAEACPVNAIKL
jgi:ferredoxin